MAESSGGDTPIWDYTGGAKNALRVKVGLGFVEKPWNGTEQSEYRGVKIIARDTPINRRMYLGVYEDGGRERIDAIEVDDRHGTGQLDKVWGYLLKRKKTIPKSEWVRGRWLNLVNDLARDVMLDSSQTRVDGVYGGRMKKGEPVHIDEFIENGVGVCRHRALVVGYLLERLVEVGKLRGKISIDRNRVGDGAHAWVRYTNSAGEVFIVDPMFGYVGRLADVGEHGWRYKRDEDKIADQLRELGLI